MTAALPADAELDDAPGEADDGAADMDTSAAEEAGPLHAATPPAPPAVAGMLATSGCIDKQHAEVRIFLSAVAISVVVAMMLICSAFVIAGTGTAA